MQTEAIVIRENERPLSKYAAKRKRIFDLTNQKIEKPISQTPLREIIKESLYSKEGAASYHKGNPFAVAFNKVIQS